MFRACFVCFCVSASVAFAQPGKVDDKKAVTFNEIERGFFVGVSGGLWATLVPPVNRMLRPGAPAPSAPFLVGQAAQVEIGFDIGERVSPALFVVGAATARAGNDYRGLGTTASGDFGMLMPGATAKVRLVGFEDTQAVRRTWIYARVSAAYVFYFPAALLPTQDVLISAGPGIEYFTRLRHFSIGLEANFNFMALTSSLGFSLLPTVRYAF